MTSPTSPGAANRGVPAWRAAPPAESARVAFTLTTVWAVTAVLWGAPYVFDGNHATTLPVLILMAGVVGLLALLTAVFVGLQSLSGRRQRLVRSVVYVVTLVGAVVVSLLLVGARVESVSGDPHRRLHGLGVWAVAGATLLIVHAVLGVQRRRP
jgi:hypothetical protein